MAQLWPAFIGNIHNSCRGKELQHGERRALPCVVAKHASLDELCGCNLVWQVLFYCVGRRRSRRAALGYLQRHQPVGLAVVGGLHIVELEGYRCLLVVVFCHRFHIGLAWLSLGHGILLVLGCQHALELVVEGLGALAVVGVGRFGECRLAGDACHHTFRKLHVGCGKGHIAIGHRAGDLTAHLGGCVKVAAALVERVDGCVFGIAQPHAQHAGVDLIGFFVLVALVAADGSGHQKHDCKNQKIFLHFLFRLVFISTKLNIFCLIS